MQNGHILGSKYFYKTHKKHVGYIWLLKENLYSFIPTIQGL